MFLWCHLSGNQRTWLRKIGNSRSRSTIASPRTILKVIWRSRTYCRKTNSCIATKRENLLNTPSTCLKLLGIYIDQSLTFYNHVDYVSKKISSSVYQMNCLKHFLGQRTMKLFYFGRVQPHIDYCSSIWDHSSDTYKNTYHPAA